MAFKTFSLGRTFASSTRLACNSPIFIRSPSVRIHWAPNPLHSSCILNKFVERDYIKTSMPFRKKSYKSKPSKEYLSDDDSDDESATQVPGSKIVQVSSDSLRCDAVLKLGLGIPRNKLDVLFYEGRIRVNEKKVPKKSFNVSVGDELDIIREFSDENPKFIQISRVEVLKARPTGDTILLTLRKHKSLMIENYPEDSWEGDSSQDVTESKLS